MRAGLLRNKIKILSPKSTARSTDGAPIITYSTIVDEWAEVQTVSAREQFRTDKRWAVTDKIFRIRYLSTVSITPDDIIVYDGENYQIESGPTNVDERDRTIEMIGRKST